MWYVRTNNEKQSSTRYSSHSPRIHRMKVYCKLNFSYHICNPPKFICWHPHWLTQSCMDLALSNEHYNFSSLLHIEMFNPLEARGALLHWTSLVIKTLVGGYQDTTSIMDSISPVNELGEQKMPKPSCKAASVACH